MKKIYEEKAKVDRDNFCSIIKELYPASIDAIPNSEITNFTKNYLTLTSVSYRTLEEEFEKVNQEFIWEGEDCNKWYFCIKAADVFQTETGNHPTPEDFAKMKKIVNSILEKNEIEKENFEIEDKYIEEM